jgi:CheY-like chemotaxis protein
MKTKTILLVEDNLQDEMLILRALRKINLANQVDVARDGQQALDYLFREGEYANRGGTDLPALILLDLNLPRIGGLNVLQQLRAAPLTKLIPVVILTSSDEERDRLSSYQNGATASCANPWILPNWPKRLPVWGFTGY